MEYDTEVSHLVWSIVAPIIIVVGTTGNVLTILVLTRSHSRKSSTSVYLVALALSDIIVIDVGLLRQWVIHLGGKDILLLSDFTCKFHWFLVYSFTELSSWLLVSVTCERLFGILWPHRVRGLCHLRSAYVVVTTLAITLFLLSSHLFYGMSIQDTDNNVLEGKARNETIEKSIHLSKFKKSNYGTVSQTSQVKCDINRKTDHAYEYFFKFIFPWIDLLVYGLIPSIILTVADILIIKRLIASKKLRLRMLNNSGLDQKLVDRSTSISIMLVTVSVVFVLCTAPMCCFLVALPYWIDANSGLSDKQQLFGTTVTLLMYLNHSINFILYAVSGASFRKKVSNLFKKIGGRSSQSVILSKTNISKIS